MALRRKAREFALQMLYQWDVTQNKPSKIEASFWKQARGAQSTRAFANRLFEGAVQASGKIDERLKKHARNWRLDRMAAIDRNILRLGVYELFYEPETPPKVILNEAVELAKKFSAEDSAGFINGVLDAISKSISKDTTQN